MKAEKLNNADILQLHDLHAKGCNNKKISKLFGVSKKMVDYYLDPFRIFRPKGFFNLFN